MPQIDETFFSVRFKYGAHTILMFVDGQQQFSEITASLLEVLRDRFPDGLTINHTSPETTAVPEGDVRLAFALPVNAADLTQGWKSIKVSDSDIPVAKGFKDNCIVAFSFDPDEPEFLVDIPTLDDELEDEEGMGSDA
ncbi:hypothetical protein CORC01_03149 [Colletotrichum orchidophilum]|uniref:Uncharacterized protein n=1 Tax=Colletotrichum orchidophilum TaxID=1209926 RepID=A0A1G4BJP2_9PEZI|nr:uncharacterized protein CORC01_03149 [Colletotrichum orchidophilum]OHF01659.1 hypothetical protein CORC01_03149 [Colletotrichum orchidophilum]